MRRGETGSTLIERPNNDPVPDFHTNAKERVIVQFLIYNCIII